MKWYSHYKRIKLKGRWKNQKPRIEAIIKDIRDEKDWTCRLLKDEERGWDELPLLQSCSDRFKLPNESASRDLRGINLKNLDLSNANSLNNTCFDLCDFEDVIMDGSQLNGASFRYAKFSKHCSLLKVEIVNSDFRFADLNGVSLNQTKFIDTKLQGANFEDSNIEQATFNNVEISEFQNEKLVSSLKGIFFTKAASSTIIGGRTQNSSNLSYHTDPHIKEYCDSCNRLIRFQLSSPRLSKFMRMFAVYGFSIHRIFLWAFLLWMSFSCIYSAFPLLKILEDTWLGNVLTTCAPEFNHSYLSTSTNAFTPFYLSIANMTTLGDGTFNPTNFWAQLYVSIQVVFGYLLLAFSVSVFVVRSYFGLKN